MRARCPNCGNPVDSDASKCGECGALFVVGAAWKPLVVSDGRTAHAAVCPNCSNPIDPDASKCDKCGALFASGAGWKPEPLPEDTEPEQRYPVEFTGAAGEYFRIWIVNLVLTLLTLGVYSAWAKVRKKRYFYGHTRIDTDSFEYRGRPIAILKGRLIAVAAVALFYGTTRFEPSFLWAVGIVAVCAAPWLIVRSMAFNAYSTAFRNIRLRFRGTYLQCLWLLFWSGLIVVATLGIAYPYFKARLMEFVFRNHSYGTTSVEMPDLSYFGTYVRAAGLSMLFAVGLILLGFGLLGLFGTDGKGRSYIATAVGYVGYLYIFCYVRVQIANKTWSAARIGKVRFECTMRTDDLFVLYLGNILAIVATLGLATPWAVVRAMRYRADRMTVFAAGGLETFVAAESAEVSAAGQEIGEMFDFDLSL